MKHEVDDLICICETGDVMYRTAQFKMGYKNDSNVINAEPDYALLWSMGHSNSKPELEKKYDELKKKSKELNKNFTAFILKEAVEKSEKNTFDFYTRMVRTNIQSDRNGTSDLEYVFIYKMI